MKISVPVYRGKDQVFFIAYGVFLIFTILSTSFYYRYFEGMLYNLILIFCAAVLIYGELLFTPRKPFVPLMICIVLYALISYINGNLFGTLNFIPLFIFCSRDIDFRKIAGFTATVSTVILLFIIGSALLGIIQNYVIHAANGRTRIFLGFRYALYPAVFAFNISALIMYLVQKRVNLWCIILVLGNWLLFKQTDARLSFYMSCFVVAGITFLRSKPQFIAKKKILCWLMILSYAICFIASLYMAVSYSSSIPWMAKLNDFLGGRIYYAQVSLLKYGVPWFGQSISWIGYGLDSSGRLNIAAKKSYNYVDCLYVQMLQHYGIIVTVFFVLLFTFVIYRCYKKEKYSLMLILFVIALKGLIDDLALYLYYNTFWFVIGNETMAYVKREKLNIGKTEDR